MIYENKRRKISKFLISTISVVMTLNFAISNYINVSDATLTSNLPVSKIKYNESDNSSVFPDSYKPYIQSLKAAHPNWIFKAVYTGLGWNQTLTQECYETKTGISTVPDSYSAAWKKDGVNTYVDGSFVIASKPAVAYTLDPRNFLNETSIFQFEALDFNDVTSTTSTIEKILAGTPMATYPTQYKKAGNMVNHDNNLKWSDIIINASKNAGGSGISAVFLATRMKQETSLDILNNYSINGSSATYPGVYNFFNIGAVPDANGNNSVTNGLRYASNSINSDGNTGWTTPTYSINAGATYLWSNYIKWGQNTTYFQKFDVSNVYGNAVALCAYQYMTNILAPSSESKITYNAYNSLGLLNSNFVFYIPVYGVLNGSDQIISDAMPDQISMHPDSLTSNLDGTDIVYLDDTSDSYPNVDEFTIRSGPGTEYNRLATLQEVSDSPNDRTKFVRIQVGTNGWDKIKLSDGREGYVYQAFVKTYNYTHVTDIALDKAIANLKVSETLTLTPTIYPTNAYIKKVIWSSNDQSVATVDNDGKVTAIKEGTATITATTLDGAKAYSCVLTVGNTQATNITMSNTQYTIVVGKYLQYSPTVAPTTTTNKNYDISVQDTTIATVEDGKVKALKAGTTNVTYTTKDGSNKSCTVSLIVTDVAASITDYIVNSSNIVTKVEIGSKASAIKDKVVTSYTKKIVNSNNVEIQDNAGVGTGSKIQILDGSNLVEEYIVAIYGDINGDANITSSDYVLVKNSIMGVKSLNSVENIGADINKDGKITASDYVLIKNHIMGIKQISAQ
ncbi:MAG: Ig-like domain-containing protein [Clostridia bacterium]|nr:Ig-like domain-containing protein [Clostridia bacterium]